MNNITTDIITTTGINISKYDILPSKVFINGIEITDTGTWNKVISSINVKDKEIDRLNNVINELEKWLEKQYQDTEKCFMFDKDLKSKYKRDLLLFTMCLDKLKELKEEK